MGPVRRTRQSPRPSPMLRAPRYDAHLAISRMAILRSSPHTPAARLPGARRGIRPVFPTEGRYSSISYVVAPRTAGLTAISNAGGVDFRAHERSTSSLGLSRYVRVWAPGAQHTARYVYDSSGAPNPFANSHCARTPTACDEIRHTAPHRRSITPH